MTYFDFGQNFCFSHSGLRDYNIFWKQLEPLNKEAFGKELELVHSYQTNCVSVIGPRPMPETGRATFATKRSYPNCSYAARLMSDCHSYAFPAQTTLGFKTTSRQFRKTAPWAAMSPGNPIKFYEAP